MSASYDRPGLALSATLKVDSAIDEAMLCLHLNNN